MPRVVLAALFPALVVFAIVQDRVTAAGAHQFVTRQRAHLASGGAGVTIEQVMAPAIRRSVEQGLLWGAVAGSGGLAAALVLRRRHRE